MDIQTAIEQAKRRAGAGYTRKRDSEGFKQSLKNWRTAEKPERIVNRLCGLGLRGEAERFQAAVLSNRAEGFDPLERIIETSQLISSTFLALGATRMRSVGRIVSESGRGLGTGFLVSPRLLMTNNHVLDGASKAARHRVEFDYVMGADLRIGTTEIYRLLPDEFFITSIMVGDLNLDYTIVAVEAVNGDGRQLSRRGCIPLIAASGKLTPGDLANIIQHPGGEVQQVAIRDNKVVPTMGVEHFIRYEADTQRGSSGSPVFNDFWQVAALHHSGVPEEVRPGVYRLTDGGEWDTHKPLSDEEQLQLAAKVKWIANEGVRVSSIVSDVQGRLQDKPDKLAMFADAVREQIPPPPEAAVTPPNPLEINTPVVLSGGAVTWTVPLRVTVQLGPEISLLLTGGATTHVTPAPAPVVTAPPPKSTADADRAAVRAREMFGDREEVLEVRSGFLWENGQMTDTPAVVIAVDPKVESAESLAIPFEIDGVPVDLTAGGPRAIFRALARRGGMAEESMSLLDLLQESVPPIGYQKPKGVKLAEVNEPMKVICHVSPDQGWPVLEQFLDRTKKTLTVGMFDLTAPHIVAKFKELGKKKGLTLNLAIERGERGGLRGVKKNDIPEATFIAAMKKLMGKRFRQAFVDVAGDDRTFASAYHIKVAVRDQEELWLSSGNMQTSNQPDIDPVADQTKILKPLRDFNREWHLVIENKKLAVVFEKFILHDLQTAEANPGEPPKKKKEVVVEVAAEPESLEAAKIPRYFDARTFAKTAKTKIRVQPLLTPDNFLDEIIPVIADAKTSLFIQNQSLTLLKEDNEEKFRKLFETIRERQKAGVEVRMIFRAFDDDAARADKDELVKFGFRKDKILVQENCHTKNVIIDSQIVILGSHNWTNQGALANRDASVIIFHEPIAKYFEEIFIFDWETLTREPRPPKPGAAKKPKGGEEAAVATKRVRVSVDALVLGD